MPLPLRAKDLAALPATISLTVDVEDLAGDGTRYAAMTRRLLDLFARHRSLGTFFVVGEVAQTNPALVRDIAASGHEIGSHSYRHSRLRDEDPATYAATMRDHRRLLEDLSGAPVRGFRAPFFSLTEATSWAADALAAAGFRYSASTIPGTDVPATPFSWPSGIVELPCPVGRVGPFRLPFLGGMYLRYLPRWRIAEAARTCSARPVWSHVHPYDIDADEPFHRYPGHGLTASFFLWWNRKNALQHLDLLLQGRRSLPLGSLVP